jgi:hypothetical protein
MIRYEFRGAAKQAGFHHFREWVAARRRAIYLTAAARRLRRGYCDVATLARLRTGWGNQGFSADLDYLSAVLEHAQRVDGPVLECGSGLTTIAMALRGVDVWTLEHHADWRRKVVASLRAVNAPARVLHTPLQDYAGVTWYSLPSELPRQFGLIICDGPPSSTRGGRAGLWSVLEADFDRVLLDDADREAERQLVRSLQANGWVVQYEGRHALLTRRGAGR